MSSQFLNPGTRLKKYLEGFDIAKIKELEDWIQDPICEPPVGDDYMAVQLNKAAEIGTGSPLWLAVELLECRSRLRVLEDRVTELLKHLPIIKTKEDIENG